MSLLDVRQLFVEKYSGRYDLVVDNSTWADAGADHFIRAGQRWLDRKFTIAIMDGQWFGSVSIGDWFALVPFVRSVDSVWMSQDDVGRFRLYWRDMLQFRGYCRKDPADMDTGKPSIYTLGQVRTVTNDPTDEAGTVTVAEFGTTVYSVASTDYYDYKAVLWLAPSDATRTIEVNGKFYQPRLTSDTDENYWTENEPDVLCMAAAMAVENSLRNQQGVQDWIYSISEQMRGLEFDLAENEAGEVHGMEG